MSRPATPHRVLTLVVLAVLLVPASAAAAGPETLPMGATARPTTHELSPSGRYIVRYRAGASDAARARARRAAGVTFDRAIGLIDADVVQPASIGPARSVRALAADPAVLSVLPDQPLQAAAQPTTEPMYPYQWGLENSGSGINWLTMRPDVDIDATAAWPTATGSGVVVAVLDDGVDFGHPDLATQAWQNPDETVNGLDDDGNGYVDDVNGVNVCPDRPTTQLHVAGDDFHGTAVASVIAAAVNDVGMTGVAYDARIMAVRFLVGQCATESFAIDALAYAVDEGAKIVNASWGGSQVTPSLDAAIAAAGQQGVLFVAASGNQGTSARHWPAASGQPNVLAVGALRPDGGYATFANYGPWVDIAAPGVAIALAEADEGTIWFGDGTSFAAPFVAGVAALIGEAHPELLGDPIALRAKLIRSGWRGGTTVAAKTGFGRVVSAEYALDFTPPVQGTAATVAPRVGDVMAATTAVAHIVWPYATDDEGVDSYRVRLRRVGGDWVWITTGTTKRYVDRSLTIAVPYEVEVFARDAGGNETSFSFPVKLVRSQETTPAAVYSTGWRSATSSTASNRGLRYATRIGDHVTFSFTGRGVAVVAPRSSGRGTAKVYVDGAYVKTISLSASSSQARRVVFSHVWPDAGPHTVRLVLAGPAGRPRVDVDAFIVTP